MKDFFKAAYYRLIFLGFNFLTGMFIATLSGAAIFGEVSLMIVNASVLYMLTGFGADQAIVWHGAVDKSGSDKIFSFLCISAFVQLCLFVLAAIIFFNLTGHTILSGKGPSKYFYFEIIYFSGLVFLEKYVSILYAKQQSKTCNQLLAIVTFIPLLYLCLTWFGMFHTPVDPIIFYSILLPLQAVTAIVYFHISNPVKFTLFKWYDLKPMLHFSAIVFITNLIQFIAYRADYWIIDHYSDNISQVGIYAQANRFAQLVWIIPNILAALLIPVTVADKKNRGVQVTILTRVTNLIHIPILGLIILAAYFLYKYFLTGNYSEGFMPLLIMLPGFYFFSITILLAAWFSAKKLLWINFAGSLICLIVIVIMDLLLIPTWGITGAAWANFIAYTSTTVFNVILFVRSSSIKWSQLFFVNSHDLKLASELFNSK